MLSGLVFNLRRRKLAPLSNEDPNFDENVKFAAQHRGGSDEALISRGWSDQLRGGSGGLDGQKTWLVRLRHNHTFD